jgi:dihydrofolate synthase/folylpolyglutamate synthase
MNMTPEEKVRIDAIEAALLARWPETRIAPTLERIAALTDILGSPQLTYPTIHVGGTNGKTSTSRMIDSLLFEMGLRTGRFTSPHLESYLERISINGQPISAGELIFAYNDISPYLDLMDSKFENPISFFEAMTALAFAAFAEHPIDVGIIEVGMGGRLDATNIITPVVSVITNIGLDHTQFLGNTLTAIAFEKAGIIKPKIPVVIGEFTLETKAVFMAKAKDNNSEIYFASELILENYPSDLVGDYQIHNKKAVVQTIAIINSLGTFKISQDAIKAGLLNVKKNTGLEGRWQQLGDSPKIICDTAHNKNGLEIVLKQIQKEKFDTLHFVLGVVNDKDLDEILPLFPTNAIYYFCKPNIPRGLDAKILQEKAALFNIVGKSYDSVSASYASALQNASKSDFVYIGGSTFVVSEIL